MIYQPTQIVLTSGVGCATKQLVSFEMALRDAGVAGFNLVQVSSILPPNVIPTRDKELLKTIKPGSIVHCVLSRLQSDEPSRVVAASVGVAKNLDEYKHGYLSEHHSFGLDAQECGTEAEDIAKEMLATIQNGEYEFNSENIAVSAEVEKGQWCTVVALAVLI